MCTVALIPTPRAQAAHGSWAAAAKVADSPRTAPSKYLAAKPGAPGRRFTRKSPRGRTCWRCRDVHTRSHTAAVARVPARSLPCGLPLVELLQDQCPAQHPRRFPSLFSIPPICLRSFLLSWTCTRWYARMSALWSLFLPSTGT